MSEPIAVVDFFAGPGGLGEGFSSLRIEGNRRAFEIALSVEKEPSARASLRLRSFFRQFGGIDDVPSSYYEYVAGRRETPWDLTTESEWRKADVEAMCASLGDREGDARIKSALKRLRLERREWVLIGGPPCQAYSLVGRSRNAGIHGYKPEDDDRHFLYRHYLRVLHELRPAAFVLENVKGVLSSTVGEQLVFPRMLRDLAEPSRALRAPKRNAVGYRILAVSTSARFEPSMNPDAFDVRNFVVKAEKHGLGQARHRVILIGIRDNIDCGNVVPVAEGEPATVGELLCDLPRLRSGLTGGEDNAELWTSRIRHHAAALAVSCANSGYHDLAKRLAAIAVTPASRFPKLRTAHEGCLSGRKMINSPLRASLIDRRVDGVLNHEARSHMDSDLARYLFCAVFAEQRDASPTADDFPPALAPAHLSWGTGAFNDRFRVQLKKRPATTITSHISKDGHYFIHHDPLQCRSLTVREAARLQGFPDNYFFEGTRTQQYVQVGNAVPPPLAALIARKVYSILKG